MSVLTIALSRCMRVILRVFHSHILSYALRHAVSHIHLGGCSPRYMRPRKPVQYTRTFRRARYASKQEVPVQSAGTNQPAGHDNDLEGEQ